MPPGNPGNEHTLNVGKSAVNSHLAHGDYLGVCGTINLPDVSLTRLVVELYEAVAPGDGRPVGPVLASTSFPVSALPGATWRWADWSEFSSAYTLICHIPPGSPLDLNTQAVLAADLAGHLSHGDHTGPCLSEKVNPNTPVLVYDTPASTLTLDVSSAGMVIEPGRAYTFVVRVDGRGTLLLSGEATSSQTHGVVATAWGGGELERTTSQVERRVSGLLRVTQTQPTDVVSSVTLALTTGDGQRVMGSATVLGQVAVPNPWMGPVPGEFPALDLAGQ